MQSRRRPSCVCGAERFCEASGKMVAWFGKGPHFTVIRAACYRARSEHALRAGMTSAENDALGRHLSEPPSVFECSCVHLKRRRRRARLVTCAQILCSQWSCWPFRKICGVWLYLQRATFGEGGERGDSLWLEVKEVDIQSPSDPHGRRECVTRVPRQCRFLDDAKTEGVISLARLERGTRMTCFGSFRSRLMRAVVGSSTLFPRGLLETMVDGQCHVRLHARELRQQ